MGGLAESIVIGVVIFTTLFGLLSRGNPRPGGVALFWRVGIAGLVIGGVLWYLVFKLGVQLPAIVARAYGTLVVGGALLTGFAAIGSWLKKKER